LIPSHIRSGSTCRSAPGFGGQITISLQAKRSTRRAAGGTGNLCSDPENARIRIPFPIPFALRYRSLLLDFSLGFVDEFRSRSVAAAGDSLSFASPKESKPRKGDPQSGSLRFAPGTFRCSKQAGSRANSPAAQTSTSPDPLASPLLSPARTGGVRIQIREPLSPLRGLNDATFLIAVCARINCAIGLNASEIASGYSNSPNAVSMQIEGKRQRVSRKFYNCTNLQYIQSQPNPHAVSGGI
jgi:hypothetical protein